MTAGIVLAGGRGERLGGADKASLTVGGRRLVDAAYAALSGAHPIVVVGPDTVGFPGASVVREAPPFGGPVAGIAAAVAELDRLTDGEPPAETWLLACDLPRADLIVAQLRDVPLRGDVDAVVLVDGDGREQWLAGRYRVASLRSALDALPDVRDAAVRHLVAVLNVHTVVDRADAAFDIDTHDDLERFRTEEEIQ